MVGIAAATLQTYTLLVLFETTNTSPDFTTVKKCQPDSVFAIQTENACSPRPVAELLPPRPDVEYLTSWLPEHVVVRKCLGGCIGSKNSFKCSPTENGVDKKTVEVTFLKLNSNRFAS